MFTTYRCGIDLIRSSVNFDYVYVSSSEKEISFAKWTFSTERCQADHGNKTKYAISSVRNDTKKIDCVTQYATCTSAGCKFTVDASCVKSQDANIVACFDGLDSGTTCIEENSKHSTDFEILKYGDGAGDCDGEARPSTEVADIFSHSQKFAVPIDDWKPLKIKISPTYTLDKI